MFALFACLLFVILFDWNAKTVYATNFGEWKTFNLPDGSKVQLNANSKLTILNDWEEEIDRRVSLEGEAFFEVAKKTSTKAKFTVVTEDLEVEVLGTMFNVYARGEATEVFLEEGEINLLHGAKNTILKPGDYLAYSAKKEKILARHRPEKELTPNAWKNGNITFKKEYAFQILKKLEEIYGVQFSIENETIYSKSYTVSVPLEKLELVIPILEKSMQVKITPRGDVLAVE